MRMVYKASDFEGTKIKSAFDQMRANAVINAQHDTRGLSIISFNICAFIQQARFDDAYFVLNEWAVAPLLRNPQKFRKYPRAGMNALYKRAQVLIKDMSKRQNIPYWFIERIQSEMDMNIEEYYAELCPNYVHETVVKNTAS